MGDADQDGAWWWSQRLGVVRAFVTWLQRATYRVLVGRWR